MRFTNVLNEEQQLIRLIWILFAALIVGGTIFGGYYYWDRYVSLDDQSPLEISVGELEHAVRQNPQDPETRLALADFYYQSGMYADSLDQSEQVLALQPENDAALFIVGMARVQMGQTNEALEPLEKFAEIHRKSPMAKTDIVLETALYFLGESYLKLERPKDAIPVLAEAIEIDYTDADAMYQLALAYAKTEQHEAALQQYHNAVRFVPNFIEVYQGMYESYTALNKPNYAAYALGMEALSKMDYETARAELQIATNNLPDFMPAYLGAGLAFEELGDLETARRYLSHASQLEPGNFLVENSLDRVELAIEANQ